MVDQEATMEVDLQIHTVVTLNFLDLEEEHRMFVPYRIAYLIE